MVMWVVERRREERLHESKVKLWVELLENGAKAQGSKLATLRSGSPNFVDRQCTSKAVPPL